MRGNVSKNRAGRDGYDGHGLNIKGVYETKEALTSGVLNPSEGDIYQVGTSDNDKTLYLYSGGEWKDIGSYQGEKGDKGDKGADGIVKSPVGENNELFNDTETHIVEGDETTKNNHLEGQNNKVIKAHETYENSYNHLEGKGNIAGGVYGHVENSGNQVYETNAHAGGKDSVASGSGAFSQGRGVIAFGCATTAKGQSAFEDDVNNTTVLGVDGEETEIDWTAKEGETEAERAARIAERLIGLWKGTELKADGTANTSVQKQFLAAIGHGAEAGGINTLVNGGASWAHGFRCLVDAMFGNASGYLSQVLSNGGFAHGMDAKSLAEWAITFGIQTTNNAENAFLIGRNTANTSAAKDSFTGGKGSQSQAEGAFTFGNGSYAAAPWSAAFGKNVVVGTEGQFAVGKYNDNESQAIFAVGAGKEGARKNAFEVFDGFIKINGNKLDLSSFLTADKKNVPGGYVGIDEDNNINLTGSRRINFSNDGYKPFYIDTTNSGNPEIVFPVTLGPEKGTDLIISMNSGMPGMSLPFGYDNHGKGITFRAGHVDTPTFKDNSTGKEVMLYPINASEVSELSDALDGKSVFGLLTDLADIKEDIKKIAIPHTTISDYPISVSDHLEGESVIDYKVYGNSVQDGTPSPDSPIEIQSVGDLVTDEASEYHGKYDIPITVAGKNLIPYPYTYTTKTINGVTFTDNGDGSITINGTAADNAMFYLVGKQDNYTLDKCGLKIGDSYTISKTLISGDGIANVYFTANYYNTSDSMKAGALASSANTATSTIQSDFKSWGIYLLVAKDKTVNNTTIKLQLEKGSTATSYEPYTPIQAKHIYLDEPLRKVGDYADYIDYKNQKVVRRVDVLDDTGTKNISESYGALSSPTEEAITAPDFNVPNSEVMNVSSGAVISPSSMDVTYYQDINKVITELKNAILAQGGNV